MIARLDDLVVNVLEFDDESKDYLLEHGGFTGWFHWDHPGLVIIDGE